jgi:hypothetical protein
MRAAGLVVAGIVALGAQACGTQQWAFYDPEAAAEEPPDGSLDEPNPDGDLDTGDAGDRDAEASDVTTNQDDSGGPCDPGTAHCPASCAGGAPCPTVTPVCTQHLQCVACRSNQDCQNVRSGPLCAQSGACVPECSADHQCPMSHPHCDRSVGRCVSN